jgi:coatomer subunit beta
VTQLTGFSDPVYAEAYVNVNQFDIVLDVLVVNQTADTLQNLTLELATLGLCFHFAFNKRQFFIL